MSALCNDFFYSNFGILILFTGKTVTQTNFYPYSLFLTSKDPDSFQKSLATRPLSSKVVGVLGVGDVGCGVAAACKHLDMTTVGYSANTTHKEVMHVL